MIDFLKMLLFSDLDTEQRTGLWRITITAIVAVFILWACGGLPGGGGFALASDYWKLAGTVSKVEASLLEKDIIEAAERVCMADKDENAEALRYAAERLRRLRENWFEMKGREFDLPTCAQLGIT